jgi:TatD DNase family protein
MFPEARCLRVAMPQHNFRSQIRMNDVTPNSLAFDAHTHLDFPAFEADRGAVLARARAAGVRMWVIAAADPAHWSRIDAVCNAFGGIACHGVHPWWIARLDDTALASHIAALETWETRGIGETGLDWVRATTDRQRERQLQSFRHHIDIAQRRQLPLVLHCVRAYDELLEILAETGAHPGMVHSWSGPAAGIGPALELGLYVSFGASLTRSARIRDAAREVPIERLLIETDCPDQPLQRGTRGEPAHLVDIAKAVALARQCEPEAILHQTAVNAQRLFGMCR